MTSVFDPELLGAEIKKETPTDTVVRKYVLERAQDKTILLKLQKETVKNALNETEKVTRYEHMGMGRWLLYPLPVASLRKRNRMVMRMWKIVICIYWDFRFIP